MVVSGDLRCHLFMEYESPFQYFLFSKALSRLYFTMVSFTNVLLFLTLPYI